MVLTLFDRVYRDALRLAEPALLLRAATGRLGGRRYLLVGERGCGKTALSLRLLEQGADVEGDDLAVVTDGGVAAVARPFYLRERHRPFLPHPEAWDTLPYVDAMGDERLWAFHPDRQGFSGRSRRARLEVVVDVVDATAASTRCHHFPRTAWRRR